MYILDDVAGVVFSKMDRDGDHALSFQEFRLHIKHKINKILNANPISLYAIFSSLFQTNFFPCVWFAKF